MKPAMLFVFANYAGAGEANPGLSGGDRITIEILRRSSAEVRAIKILTGASGRTMYGRYLKPTSQCDYQITSRVALQKQSLLNTILFVIEALVTGVIVYARCARRFGSPDLLLSGSDFLPDVVPGVLAKRKRPATQWIAPFYIKAPHPFAWDSPYRMVGRVQKTLSRLRAVLYFLSQQFSLLFILKYADGVLVTSDPDKHYLVWRGVPEDNILVISGGVNFEEATSFSKSDPSKYDAVFVGRLYPQKGVLQLLDIWSKVIERRPEAKLALIGDGPLDRQVRKRIDALGLQHSVELFGFRDGAEKYAIITSSRVFAHPAIYDSGGMAMCEAMAFGLPGVSFDLPALKTYYPQGVVKVPCFDLEEFSKAISTLLSDPRLYERLSTQAVALAMQWDWGRRVTQFWAFVRGLDGDQKLKLFLKDDGLPLRT